MPNIDITCKKCPCIKGKTWCEHHQAQVWCEDEMCVDGYHARIEKGVNKCSDIWHEYGDESADGWERIKKIMAQVDELSDIVHEKFYKNKEEINVEETEAAETEIPF